MGVDGVVLGCPPGGRGQELGTVVTSENVDRFARQAHEARDHGLACEWVYPDWNLIEKTIDDPRCLNTVRKLFDALAEHGLSDLLVSCGLRNLEALSAADRATYKRRFAEHLDMLYRHAEPLGLHLCLHTSLMPWVYLRDVEAWDRWFREFPCEANSIVLCLGCTESAGLDALELIGKWNPRIRAVHVRNVVGRFENRTHEDVRLDGGTLALPPVFDKLARLDFRGAVIPEHFPELPCAEGLSVSRAFALGYTRALIQVQRTSLSDREESHP